jgi:hypothetical protein
MSKINNIIEGFTNELPLNEDWWKNRMSICGSCEFNSLNGAELSVMCKTAKAIGCPSKEKGSCSKCCCCLEQKTSVKSEECPLGKWKAMETVSNQFKVTLKSIGEVKVQDKDIVIEVGNITEDFLRLDFETNSVSKNLVYEGAKAGCSCTTTFPKELKRGRSYEHSISISIASFGKQNKKLELYFVGNNRDKHVLPIIIKYNRINTEL